MSETDQNKTKFLNLQQQNIRTIERHLEITYKTSSPEEYFIEKNKEELVNSVVEEQTRENNSYEECKNLWNEYQDWNNLMEIIVNYLECLKMTKLTSLSFVEKLSEKFPELTQTPNENSDLVDKLDVLQETLSGTFSQSVDNNLQDLWADLESAHKNYSIATKNFKILLEILDFECHDLYKLKKQYDDLLVDFEHAKTNIENELPNQIRNRSKVLRGGLSVWESLQNSFTNESSEFAVLVSDLKNALSISDDE